MSDGQKWLMELTQIPTAAGREQRVIDWVLAWAGQRRVVVRRDRFGNVMLSLGKGGNKPVVLEAHLDHPAFVVAQVDGPSRLTADFRGAVTADYFAGGRVRLHLASGRSVRGRVASIQPRDQERPDHRVEVELARPAPAAIADVLTWDLPAASVKKGLLHTLACDNLAGVAAALAALDRVLRLPMAKRRGLDVRVLLTRAEEVGFVGAIAAARSGIVPKAAKIIVLETSKSMADSPIGAGPIVRVGDRTSTFTPGITYTLSCVAEELAGKDRSFKYQRKLMAGGTCNASAYHWLGYASGCLCLALGNYHNMNEKTGRIDREFIAISDWHGLVDLLVAAALALSVPGTAPRFSDRLEQIFRQRRGLLGD